jgi:hypothetical protein
MIQSRTLHPFRSEACGIQSRPHRLVAQDGALSRPKQGFESPWGHKESPNGGSFYIQTGARLDIQDRLFVAYAKQALYSDCDHPVLDFFSSQS